MEFSTGGDEIYYRASENFHPASGVNRPLVGRRGPWGAADGPGPADPWPSRAHQRPSSGPGGSSRVPLTASLLRKNVYFGRKVLFSDAVGVGLRWLVRLSRVRLLLVMNVEALPSFWTGANRRQRFNIHNQQHARQPYHPREPKIRGCWGAPPPRRPVTARPTIYYFYSVQLAGNDSLVAP